MNFELKLYNRNISDDEIVQDIIRVAKELGTDAIAMPDYQNKGKFSASLIEKRFGWNNAVKKAGLTIKNRRNISQQDLFQEIERVWRKLGKQPSAAYFKGGNNTYGSNTFVRIFGSWQNALIEFIKYVENSDPIANENAPSIELPAGHKTGRDINLRLRFMVLRRDHFKCVMCGKSPAIDQNTELHVDHIIPWSKGGETIITNLQSLCQNCNLGKSNLSNTECS